jgi:hypothetical protein
MESLKVKTLSEYLQIVETLKEKWKERELWYRGVGNVAYSLTPTLYRSEYEIDCKEEYSIFNDFRLKAKLLIPNSQSMERLDWYSVMQHYGLPTRMLDWTTGSLIALYFALRDTNAEVDRAVFVLNQSKINSTIHHLDMNYESGRQQNYKELLDKYIPNLKIGEYPIAITPPYIDKRIIAQKGRFTIHGNLKDSLEDICDKFCIDIEKIIIEDPYVYLIKMQLVEAGITESVLFPDLEGLAREFIFEYVMD